MKKNRFLLITLGVLLVLVIGLSFAYFVVETKVVGSGANTNMTTANLMKVVYDAGSSSLNATNLMPGHSASKGFKVTITPTEEQNSATYGIYLDITSNTFVKCTDANYNAISNDCEKDAQELKYRIKDSSGNILATGDLTAKTGRVELLKESKTVTSATDFNYTIEIEFKDTNKDQNHNANKTIEGNVVVEFTTIPLATEHLISTNEMIEENGYRYEGKNPNNYVTFNNELWRIIGVFDVINSDTNTSESLVKIIRNESIGKIAWDTLGDYGSNDWTSSDLKTILNGQYYNGEDINYTYRNPNNTEIGSDPQVLISGKSINDTSRTMIQSVKWNLGGSSSADDVTSGMFYTRERSTEVYSGHATEWNGYIGLMYPSDYGYAVDSESCPRTTTVYNYYSVESCKNNNWLFNISEWTLTPESSTSYTVFFTSELGYVLDYYANISFALRPSLYLESSIKITGGEGTTSNPYTLSM